jgi:hypothetical protein
VSEKQEMFGVVTITNPPFFVIRANSAMNPEKLMMCSMPSMDTTASNCPSAKGRALLMSAKT